VFPDRSVGTRAPLTAGRVREMLPDFPAAANSGNLVDLLRVLQTGEQEEAGRAGPGSFDEDTTTGYRFYNKGKTVLPSGVNPKRAGSAVPITGPDGERIGMGLPNRGGLTRLEMGEVKDKDRYNRLSKQLNTLIAAQGRAYLPAAAAAYQKQIDAVVSQIQELEEEATPAPAGGASKRYKMVNGKLVLQ